jgi:hypothetical protein
MKPTNEQVEFLYNLKKIDEINVVIALCNYLIDMDEKGSDMALRLGCLLGSISGIKMVMESKKEVQSGSN